MVNSSPQYVGPPSAGYPDADYATFVSTYKSRSPMLYVGANDGMLHAIRADKGTESFAYIPSPFFSSTASGIPATLPALTNRAYAHKYYVDGTPVTGDAKVNGNWATVLVSSLGAGGAGIFALDVTNPDNITEATASQAVLWEFTNQVDADLGYTFGQPSIVKLANGKWAAIFGNGYNSTAVNANADGSAYLYVVFLDRQAGSQSWVAGTDYLKIPTGTGSKTNPNGLSQPTAADVNQDGITDYIYAGDLLGDLWKFDVSNTNPTKWGVPSPQTGTQPRTPLFIATNSSNQAQPITSPVDITRNPAGGFLVLFGTGRYLDTSDPSDQTVQSFYGIWDQNLAVVTTVPRSALVQQSILQQVTSKGYMYRMVSQNPVIYGNGSSQKGWYMDLVYPANNPQGERVAYGPSVRGDRIIFTTLIPSTAQCQNGGTSWLMELQALSGGHLVNISPFDVNGDRNFTSADYLPDPQTQISVPVGGRGSTVGITPAPTVTKCGPGRECKISSGSSANLETISESAANPSGRLAWREILH
ncbi:pilus assembly protein [Cupriavidus sp. D39]|uniref:pilus assembly protein n=1 Tax=Cupriavidus sp. D39 TaxID=2997877 RepID=UPI00226FC55C|nr:PilC/PilY family type IV pilus protein [Cupriavidus sp. D39]MCY0856156.1 PilC/PilY family type IV pilus protein [Cupriavidus sp. D39]